MTTLKIATGFLLMMCSIAHTEDTSYSKSYYTCIDASGGATFKIIDCINDELTKQDKRLNAAYKRLCMKVSPDQKKLLVISQRRWIKYRDANCSFYADPEGGSVARINGVACHLKMTTQRAKEMEDLAK